MSEEQLSPIEAIAQQRREEKREELSKIHKPDFLIETQQAEIHYTINPSFLPFANADIDVFSSSLNELYKLNRKEREVVESDNPIKMLMGQKQQSGLIYENGKFQLSNKEFIPISRVRLTEESIKVILKGDASVAETIIADIAESLWASADANKSWSEIEKGVQIKAYGTSTRVNLGIPLEKFLNSSLTYFLDENCINGKEFGKKMMPQSALSKFSHPKNLMASYVLDDLNLLFNLFDPSSGESYRAKLQFRVTAEHEYGTGVYTVVSQLPFDTHMECLQKMVESINV